MNPQRIIRTGVDGTTPVHSGINGTSTPTPSGISGTSISGTSTPDPIGIIGTIISGTSTPDPIGIIGTSDAPPFVISETSSSPPYCGLWSPRIGNIQQSTSPNFINSDELNATVYRKFSNDPIVPPVSTQVFGDKLSNSPIRDIYTRCRLNLATESVNPVAPQLMNHGLSAVDELNKISGIWIPDTRIIRSRDITHWSGTDHAVGQGVLVVEAVDDKSDYSEENYKTDFEIWMENSKLQFKHKNVERI